SPSAPPRRSCANSFRREGGPRSMRSPAEEMAPLGGYRWKPNIEGAHGQRPICASSDHPGLHGIWLTLSEWEGLMRFDRASGRSEPDAIAARLQRACNYRTGEYRKV